MESRGRKSRWDACNHAVPHYLCPHRRERIVDALQAARTSFKSTPAAVHFPAPCVVRCFLPYHARTAFFRLSDEPRAPVNQMQQEKAKGKRLNKSFAHCSCFEAKRQTTREDEELD